MSILLAVPCYGGQLSVPTFRSIWAITMLLPEVDVLVVEGESAITRGRSNLAATFLESGASTLAMLDADIEIAATDFAKLIALREPIRGAAVPMKTKDHSELLSCWQDGRVVKRAEMPDEPFEVDYLGGACLLVDRPVIAELSGIDELKYVDSVMCRPGAHIFIERVVDGILLSEDYSFCWLARQHGYKVLCHPEVVVSHYGVGCWRA